MSIIRPRVWTQQPQIATGVDWGNPITRGMVFCAIPFGATMLDLVTGALGTPIGTTQTIKGITAGKSRRSDGIAVETSGYQNKVVWPISNNRGATMVQEASILVMGGATAQIDGYQYCFAGNTEYQVNGDGFSLGIDSYNYDGYRGAILKGAAISAKGGSPSTSILGNPFNNQTHFFGYSALNNGTNGNWFIEGKSVSYSGKAVHGTTTSYRRASVNSYCAAIDNANLKHDCYTLLAIFWDRAISPAEYASLYDNPWQIFRPRVT